MLADVVGGGSFDLADLANSDWPDQAIEVGGNGPFGLASFREIGANAGKMWIVLIARLGTELLGNLAKGRGWNGSFHPALPVILCCPKRRTDPARFDEALKPNPVVGCPPNRFGWTWPTGRIASSLPDAAGPQFAIHTRRTGVVRRWARSAVASAGAPCSARRCAFASCALIQLSTVSRRQRSGRPRYGGGSFSGDRDLIEAIEAGEMPRSAASPSQSRNGLLGYFRSEEGLSVVAMGGQESRWVATRIDPIFQRPVTRYIKQNQ